MFLLALVHVNRIYAPDQGDSVEGSAGEAAHACLASLARLVVVVQTGVADYEKDAEHTLQGTGVLLGVLWEVYVYSICVGHGCVCELNSMEIVLMVGCVCVCVGHGCVCEQHFFCAYRTARLCPRPGFPVDNFKPRYVYR